MKCKTCADEGTESKIYDLGVSRTLLAGVGAYWDEQGVRHYHDPNTEEAGYRCSRNHFWSIKSKPKCPAEGCAYNQPQPRKKVKGGAQQQHSPKDGQ